MTTTLSEGVKVPDVGSVNWAGDLEVNWNLLNGALANLSGNVKLDRDNTWTGEQSFTLPIVGSIAGTAAKAIADEDGTSIKTGYGKLASNQTWTGTNTCIGTIRFNNSAFVSGTPSADVFYTRLQWGGYVNNTWTAPFTINNAIRTNGYSDTSFRTYSQTSNTLTGFVHETNADASDIAFRPMANGTHKLGSSFYQWSSVYAQSYYYNGTAWGLDKANTWTHSQTIKNADYQIGEIPSAAKARYINFTDKNNVNIGWIQRRIESNGDSSIELFVYNRFTNSQPDTAGTLDYAMLKVGLKSDQTHFCEIMGDTYPRNSNTYNLGTTTNKWKTLNGVNPGALSLPNITAEVNIASSITDVTGGDNWYEPAVDGYLSVIVRGTVTIMLFNTTHRQNYYGVSCVQPDADGKSCAYLPVKTPYHARIRVIGTVDKAAFYPCLGNV